MQARGTFEVTSHPEPPYETSDGIILGRMRLEKRFSGPLEASAAVQMTYARTPVEGSAGYVAIERVTGTLDGKRGSFILQHSGVMTRGTQSLTVTIVPDSATGDLQGLSGTMQIDITQGQHHYTLDYELGSTAAS